MHSFESPPLRPLQDIKQDRPAVSSNVDTEGRPGLGLDEKAEAVRLARAGVSMRAIGRRMGVDRKAVRAALVEAGLIADKIIDGVS